MKVDVPEVSGTLFCLPWGPKPHDTQNKDKTEMSVNQKDQLSNTALVIHFLVIHFPEIHFPVIHFLVIR